MQQQASRFGIYLNDSEKKVVRINSPYWFPEEPEWVFITPEVNATLLSIRELAREQGLSGGRRRADLGHHPHAGRGIVKTTGTSHLGKELPPPQRGRVRLCLVKSL